MTNEQKQMLETLTEKINECEQLAYKLASSFDIGEARIKAFQAYGDIRLTALAVGKIGN